VQPKQKPTKAGRDSNANSKPITNDENRAPEPKTKKARKQKDTAPEKGESSQAIGFDDLLTLSLEEHDIIEASFEKAKREPSLHFPLQQPFKTNNNIRQSFSLQHPMAGMQGVFRTTLDGCIYTVRKNDVKGDGAGKKGSFKGDVNPYPEFNSNCIARLGTRRYRMYQVSAVKALKKAYPDLTLQQLKQWAAPG
jgi:hypothetical protein